MPGIYIASKTIHAKRWQLLKKVHPTINSSWIMYPDNKGFIDFEDLWKRCIKEVQESEALIIYAEPGDVFKGVFIELGVALSCNIPVYAIGMENYTISKHKLIKHFPNFHKLFEAIYKDLSLEG